MFSLHDTVAAAYTKVEYASHAHNTTEKQLTHRSSSFRLHDRFELQDAVHLPEHSNWMENICCISEGRQDIDCMKRGWIRCLFMQDTQDRQIDDANDTIRGVWLDSITSGPRAASSFCWVARKCTAIFGFHDIVAAAFPRLNGCPKCLIPIVRNQVRRPGEKLQHHKNNRPVAPIYTAISSLGERRKPA
jgi:hypothetical protein